VIFFAGFTPPQLTFPAASVLWGTWMLRLRVNEQVNDDQNVLANLLDDTTSFTILSRAGLRDIGARESTQFTTATTRLKRWLRSLQRTLRAIDALLPYQRVLAANATTSVITRGDINAAFSITAAPFEVWEIEFEGSVQCSSTGGSRFAITAPAGSTVDGWLFSTASALATPSTPQRFTAIDTLSATAVHTVAAVPAPDRIRAVITVGATGGAIKPQFASNTAAQTTTIFAGASFRARKLS
jgi:hypothetical protein